LIEKIHLAKRKISKDGFKSIRKKMDDSIIDLHKELVKLG